MSVLAEISFIRANPVETIQISFNSINEVFACNDCIFRHLSDFGAWVLVNVDVSGFCLRHSHIMRVFAALTFLTHTSFKVWAESRLVVHLSIFINLHLSDLFKQRSDERVLFFLLFFCIFFLSICILDCSLTTLNCVLLRIELL